MIGAILLAIVLVFVIPIGVMMSGAFAAAVLGESHVTDAETRYEGSEYIEMNK